MALEQGCVDSPGRENLVLEAAVEAVGAAARAIAALGAPAAFTKPDASPVTIADVAAQCAAAAVLQQRLGAKVRIAGEEDAETLQGAAGADVLALASAALAQAGCAMNATEVARTLDACGDSGGSGSFWALDPLDGTKGYLRGGQFVVALARVDDGVPTVAAMACPRLPLRGVEVTSGGLGVIAGATRTGAWQAPLDSPQERQPIRCAPWQPGIPFILGESIEAAHSAHGRTAAMLATAGAFETVRIDSQCKYLLVARGDAHCFLRVPPKSGYAEKVWDHAAGALIATAAGAVVSDALGGALEFSSGRTMNAGVGACCAVPRLHQALFPQTR